MTPRSHFCNIGSKSLSFTFHAFITLREAWVESHNLDPLSNIYTPYHPMSVDLFLRAVFTVWVYFYNKFYCWEVCVERWIQGCRHGGSRQICCKDFNLKIKKTNREAAQKKKKNQRSRAEPSQKHKRVCRPQNKTREFIACTLTCTTGDRDGLLQTHVLWQTVTVSKRSHRKNSWIPRNAAASHESHIRFTHTPYIYHKLIFPATLHLICKFYMLFHLFCSIFCKKKKIKFSE